MPPMGEVDRTWKVGELARATGLTIRTLHHYDDIGLVVPGRTGSGHRVYSPADVERLYRVLALRSVGMALDEQRRRLLDRLHEMLGALQRSGAVEAMTVVVSLIDTVRRHVAAVERDTEISSSTVGADEIIAVLDNTSEASIEDVVTRERWEAAWELQQPYMVLLQETDGERILPIYIGEPEARALVLQRRGATRPRPQGHDLMVALLGALDARVERIVIERLRDNTFFATVTVVTGNDPREIDARPSDALNLALRSGAPIQVASEVIDTAGLTSWPETQQTVAGDRQPPPWTPISDPRDLWRTPTYTIDENSPMMLRLAATQARELGHRFVGPAHLLLGLLADDDGPAKQLLNHRRITLVPTREAIASKLSDVQDAPSPGATMSLTSGAMLAMNRASIEARRRGTLDITPMHLLLALVDSRELADVPSLNTTDLASVRDDVRAKLDA